MEQPVQDQSAETPVRTLPEILRARAEQLASVRRQQFTADGMLREARLKFEAEHKELIDLARELGETELSLLLDLKLGAAKHYQATCTVVPQDDGSEKRLSDGDKAPCPGVVVRVRPSYDIDETRAWEWIREHKMQAQLTNPASLNRSAITKLAGATDLPFVAKIETIVPAVDADLDKAFAKAQKEAA